MVAWGWAPAWSGVWMAGAWVIGITVIVWAVTALFPNQPHHDRHGGLDERFAAGGLGEDEYRRRCDEPDTHARSADRPRA